MSLRLINNPILPHTLMRLWVNSQVPTKTLVKTSVFLFLVLINIDILEEYLYIILNIQLGGINSVIFTSSFNL